MTRTLCSLAAAVCLLLPAVSSAGEDCPLGRGARSPEQVITEHLAALASGDLDRILCDYAPNAVVVMPGAVLRGHAEIRAGLAQMMGLFSGAVPEILSMTTGGDAVLSLWRLETPAVVVENGVDTFVVRGGRIVTQTVFAPVQFR